MARKNKLRTPPVKAKTAMPTEAWTTRELRAYIRKATAELNAKYKGFEETIGSLKENSEIMYRQRERLIEISGVKARGGKVGLGLTYKTKSELLLQARALVEAERVENSESYFYTEAGKSQAEASIKTLEKNYGISLNLDEYHEMTEALGAVQSNLKGAFASSEVALKVGEAAKAGIKSQDIVSTLVNIKKEGKGKGIDMTTLVDAIEDLIAQTKDR